MLFIQTAAPQCVIYNNKSNPISRMKQLIDQTPTHLSPYPSPPKKKAKRHKQPPTHLFQQTKPSQEKKRLTHSTLASHTSYKPASSPPPPQPP